MTSRTDGPDLVVGLCAAWCRVCTGFEPEFHALAGEWPAARFIWLDIEDDCDIVGDVEVEDFPTLAVYREGRAVHFGPVLPHAPLVRRLVAELLSGDRPAIAAGEALTSLPLRLPG